MEEQEINIKVSADTSEFEEKIDKCIEKVKELARLCECAGKLFDGSVRKEDV